MGDIMYYEIRIEPKDPNEDMTWEKIQQIIQEAFEKHGGLFRDGLQLLNVD